jgi:hypothetical protein
LILVVLLIAMAFCHALDSDDGAESDGTTQATDPITDTDTSDTEVSEPVPDTTASDTETSEPVPDITVPDTETTESTPETTKPVPETTTPDPDEADKPIDPSSLGKEVYRYECADASLLKTYANTTYRQYEGVLAFYQAEGYQIYK